MSIALSKPIAPPTVTHAVTVSKRVQNGPLCRLINQDKPIVARVADYAATPPAHVQSWVSRLERECLLVEMWEAAIAKTAVWAPGDKRWSREEKLSREILEDLKPIELQWLQDYEHRHFNTVSKQKAAKMAQIAGLWQHYEVVDADPREVLEAYVMVRIHEPQERYQHLEAFCRQFQLQATRVGFGPFTVNPRLELELRPGPEVQSPLSTLAHFLDRRDVGGSINSIKENGERLTVHFDALSPSDIGTMIEEARVTIRVKNPKSA